MENGNFIGKKIRLLRKWKKLTQKELGKRIGVRQETISAIESNELIPKLDKFLELCTEFNISPNSLVEWEINKSYLNKNGNGIQFLSKVIALNLHNMNEYDKKYILRQIFLVRLEGNE